MNTKTKNWLFVIISCAVVGFLAADIIWEFRKQQDEKQPPAYYPQQAATSTALSTSPIQEVDNTTKTYRNTEWGFEFQYPKNWTVKEDSFVSYYSKFNVIVAPSAQRHSAFPALVNVVLPTAINSHFFNAGAATSTVEVGGLSGIKYVDKFEGAPETSIVLPFGDYKIILGTDNNDSYTNVFNQIVSTFKFLK